MFDSRLRHYDALFDALGIAPLGERRLFDAGCGNGKWLEICCRKWGAQESNCFGNDQRDAIWQKWRQAITDTAITFIHRPTHELELAPCSFDVVHQSMMLSSIVDPWARARTAKVLWRLLRPGGVLISYDFWLNPLNPAAVGIQAKELHRLFPQGRHIHSRQITLAPPIGRSLVILGKSTALAMEKIRVLNSHLLIALQRPSKDSTRDQ